MFSKALAKVLPSKALMLVQNLVCFLLVLVMCLVSFGTIFTVRIDLSDAMRDKLENIIRVATPEGEQSEIVIPDEIDVSLPYIIGSTGKVIGSAKNLMTVWNDIQELQRSANSLKDKKAELDQATQELNDAKQEGVTNVQEKLDNVQREMDGVQKELDEVEEKLGNVKEELRSMITQELVSILALAFTVASCFGTNLLLAICYIFLFCTAITLPLTAVVYGILALIFFFARVTRPERAFHRVARSFAGIFSLLPLILIAKIMVPGVELGYGVWGLLACVVAGLVISLTMSRLKYYEKPDFKYLNVLQIVSACSVGAFLLFFFTVLKSGVVGAMIARFGAYEASSGGMRLLSWGLVGLFFVVLGMSFDYMIHVFTRFACMSKSRSDKHIVLTSIHMLAAVIPFVLMFTEFGLELEGTAQVCFILASVGLLLMLVAEIVLAVLDKTLCKEVSKERRRAIVTGTYIYVAALEIEPVVVEEASEITEAIETAEPVETAEVSQEAEAADQTVVAQEATVEEAVQESAEEAAQEAVAEETVQAE